MPDDLIVVAQADRKIAASIADSGRAKAINRGEMDYAPIVQAFARHRQQAEDAMREACAGIADQHRASRWLAKDDALKRKARSEARDHESMAIEGMHIATTIRAATLSNEGE